MATEETRWMMVMVMIRVQLADQECFTLCPQRLGLLHPLHFTSSRSVKDSPPTVQTSSCKAISQVILHLGIVGAQKHCTGPLHTSFILNLIFHGLNRQ